MYWWNVSSVGVEAPCFSLPLYPPGRPLVTVDSKPCFPVLDETLELIFYFTGCILNLIIISLILRSAKRSKPSGGESVPRLLVLVLCVTELIFLVLGETSWVVSFIAGKWTGDIPVYLFAASAVVACSRLSKCIVVVMGIERYLSIKKPFFYDNSVTPRRIGVVILGIIFYSVSLSGFFIAGVTTRTWEACPASASKDHCLKLIDSNSNLYDNQTKYLYLNSAVENAYEYFTLLEGVVMTVVLISCNVVVIRCMQRLKAHLELACPRNREEYMKQVDMIRGAPADFSRLMVAIAVVFVVCILPYEIRWFSNQLDVWHSETLDYIAVRLYLGTCVINPLMYGIFRRNVRRKIMANTRKLLRKCCCCCKASNKVRPQRTEAERWRTPSTISGSLADSRAT
ncbi:prostaglandin E2 receptor EP4 subtype-like [Asterias rubens]|uniref:prostaglandin E2 receptor EP4 subtype-like n=1 Tax=Asterias rubens TaxID=7604 RepID=UPI0014555693|nr:prostaglandin E2 receptor EP4 subtype-like [Asterias rubens]